MPGWRKAPVSLLLVTRQGGADWGAVSRSLAQEGCAAELIGQGPRPGVQRAPCLSCIVCLCVLGLSVLSLYIAVYSY